MLVPLLTRGLAEVELPQPKLEQRIVIAADHGRHWTEGQYDVWLLQGNCYINQGLTYARSHSAVVWARRGGEFGTPPNELIVFLEGDVVIDYENGPAPSDSTSTIARQHASSAKDRLPSGAVQRAAQLRDRTWFGRMRTSQALSIQVATHEGEPTSKPAVYQHALVAREPQPYARRAQFVDSGSAASGPAAVVPAPAGPGPQAAPQLGAPSFTPPSPQPSSAAASGVPGGAPEWIVPPPPGPPASRPFSAPRPAAAPDMARPVDLPPSGVRRVRAFPRYPGGGVQAQFTNDPATGEPVAVITSGVNIIVDGIRNLGSIDVQTDTLVVWGLSGIGEQNQAEDAPLELYMEGNIVFQQGERVIEAQRMYYDVRRKLGIVLAAELRGPVPNYEGLLKLRADIVRMLDEQHFVAENVSLTSSRFGVPGYDIRTGVLTYQDVQQPVINAATGQAEVDPLTGAPLVDHQRFASSRNNFLYVENVPVFYWPFLASDLEKSNYYIERVRFRQDSIFGTQFLIDFDAYQVFNIKNPPAGTKWDLSLDVLSERGVAVGTNFLYDRAGLFNIPGRYYGVFDAWGLKDNGEDNLGRDRRAVPPEADFRGRILGRHRHFLDDGFQLSAELGLISDRNFLEQYYEHEWDEFKDQTTGVELKQTRDNMSWALSVDVRPMGFWTDTQSLPRLDHFWLGQPLLGDRITWFEHSTAAYQQLRTASTPLNPPDFNKFTLEPYEAGVNGERFSTKHELDFPIALGPAKLVPYALGELDHWGAGLDGNDRNRAYTQLGVRASLPMWSVDPDVQSDLFYLNGIAHKMSFDVDVAYSASTLDMKELPLYDPLDDNNIETFRRRFAFDTFGTPLVPQFPLQFDPRTYALRSGLAGQVTSPSVEVADDLLALRLGWRQRWQTKRGNPNAPRIVDWITLDTHAVLFPNPSRDNFDQVVGLVDYNFIWNIGDRVSLVSDGLFDFFANSPRYVSVGGYLARPPRGSIYFGIRSMEGPISTTVLTSAYTYRMNDKWASTMSSNYAFGRTGNIGQSFSLTRIGESLLVSLGLNIDASKGNVGASFLVEPRFLPRSRLSSTGGLHIPPAGAFGLE